MSYGSIMGYGARRFEVIGEDEDGNTVVAPVAITAPLNRLTKSAPVNTTAVRQRMLALPDKPSWRQGELAPGVQAVDEGMLPLPLTPLQNGGLFTSTVNAITFQGQLQKPYRPERLFSSTAVTLALATNPRPRILGQIFMGTDLQQADIAAMDVEVIGAPTAFGVRMTLSQAPPGVLLRMPCTLSGALTAGDTILLTMFWQGRVIH